MLTVTVDRPEGVSIDQCRQVSRALDPMLDEKDSTICRPIRCAFPRQVSPPQASGAFPAFMGQTVEVGFYKPMNGKKQIERANSPAMTTAP